jgi:hypothetical protein
MLQKEKNLKNNIKNNIMIEKCRLSETEIADWKMYLAFANQVSDLPNIQPFCLPSARTGSCFREPKQQTLPIDTGVRPIDVVTHRNFPARVRNKTKKAQDDDLMKKNALEPIKKGDFVVLDVKVKNNEFYKFPFLIAQLIEDAFDKDTTHPDTKLLFQIYRPSNMNNIASKFTKWVGDTNIPWKDHFDRGLVKAFVFLQVKGKCLAAKSREMLEETFF